MDHDLMEKLLLDIVDSDDPAVRRKAARQIAAVLSNLQEAVLGLATGAHDCGQQQAALWRAVNSLSSYHN